MVHKDAENEAEKQMEWLKVVKIAGIGLREMIQWQKAPGIQS